MGRDPVTLRRISETDTDVRVPLQFFSRGVDYRFMWLVPANMHRFTTEGGTTARMVRSKLLTLRNEDFVQAAKLAGCSNTRLVAKHMLPSFMSY